MPINTASLSLINLTQQYPLVHDAIYRTYAKGIIQSSDFVLYSDNNLQHGGKPVDMIWQAGNVIHIATRYHLMDSALAFKQAMQHAFMDAEMLAKLLRLPKGLDINKQEGRVYQLAANFIGLDPIAPLRKREVPKCVKSIHTTVVIRDVKTGREEIVEVVNGNAFDAQDIAIRRLYGESQV